MRMRVLTVRGRTTIVGAVRTGPQGPPGGGGGGGDVASVFGRTGAVVAETGDYDVSQVTDAVATDDPRLSDARTPTAHAASHATGQSDALAPADIGAVPTSRTVSAGTGLSGGGDLTANRTLAVSFGSTSSTACVGNDARLSDSRAPTGSASGDLGGTYPSPTVTQARGLRETAGPTTLAMGAVADGQLLVRNGSSVIGATAPPVVAPINETGTTRTLSASDHGRTILCTHASGCAITVPHTLAAGTACIVRALGGAPVTVAGSGGLTVRPSPGCDAEIVDGGTAAIEVESATAAALVGELEESP